MLPSLLSCTNGTWAVEGSLLLLECELKTKSLLPFWQVPRSLFSFLVTVTKLLDNLEKQVQQRSTSLCWVRQLCIYRGSFLCKTLE